MKRKGFTLVEIMIVVAIIALLAAIAIPSLLRTRATANETSAQTSLRTMGTAMENFRITNGVYTGATLSGLSTATPPYIDNVLGSGAKQGYNFALTVVDSNSYVITAIAQTPSVSGVRSFCISEDGVIRVRTAGGAVADRAACIALNATQ